MRITIEISDDEYRKIQDGRASVVVMRDAIRNGTPLEQEPKTGQWWTRNTYPQECECWECSECKETVFEQTNYCPNCGAKME